MVVVHTLVEEVAVAAGKSTQMHLPQTHIQLLLAKAVRVEEAAYLLLQVDKTPPLTPQL